MYGFLKWLFVAITPGFVRQIIVEDWKSKDHLQSFGQISLSQEGEDLILKRIFSEQKGGFYIDVGAYHPFKFSNTYLFYLKGWQGINIEARPGSKALFDEFRKNDINLELGVSESGGIRDYYKFEIGAVSTFSKSEAKFKQNNGYTLEEVLKVKTSPLKNILDEHLPEGQTIDFLTVDVEGFDLQVLKSNDWNLYRPTYIVVETLRSSMVDVMNSELSNFLKEVGYDLIGKTFNSCLFCEITRHR